MCMLCFRARFQGGSAAAHWGDMCCPCPEVGWHQLRVTITDQKREPGNHCPAGIFSLVNKVWVTCGSALAAILPNPPNALFHQQGPCYVI